MRALLACVCLATGCSSRAAPGPTAAPANRDAATPEVAVATGSATFAGVLTAPATVASSTALTAHLAITNPGPDPLILTRGALDLAVLAVEVRDADDRRVPTIPPPVPQPEDADPIAIAPGQALARDYRLDVFSPTLPPGRYTLHCRVVACAPRAFAVAP
ncbi:MAG: hypothetical protein JNK64_10190 [Myxococcales bacterium]|nr:hypothetical protein [Myxococcales bacterium]